MGTLGTPRGWPGNDLVADQYKKNGREKSTNLFAGATFPTLCPIAVGKQAQAIQGEEGKLKRPH